MIPLAGRNILGGAGVARAAYSLASGPTTIMHDTCSGSINVSISGRTPDTVGTNTWINELSRVIETNGAGLFRIDTGSGTVRAAYDLGQATHECTFNLKTHRGVLLFTRFLNNSNFFRIEVYSTAVENRIDITKRVAGVTTVPVRVTSTGLTDGTLYQVKCYTSSTAIRYTVATAAAPETLIFDNTVTDSALNTEQKIATGNVSSAYSNGTWDEFECIDF